MPLSAILLLVLGMSDLLAKAQYATYYSLTTNLHFHEPLQIETEVEVEK